MNIPERLHTKWGTTRVNAYGYHVISSRKEGYHNQFLHRLIYEEVMGIKLPSDVVIHHKDGNTLNNCILNLEIISNSDHMSLHHQNGDFDYAYDKRDSGKQISQAKNTSGYFRTSKQKNIACKQGFIWNYRYINENGKRKCISSVDINKLEEKVLAKGLPWIKFSDVEVEA